MSTPLVSVVIPTRGRPELVLRAVRTALAQTLREIEVIVVIDGPDPATRAALAGLDDPRLRAVELDRSHGAPGARNVGVAQASAPWTAFLDDDDEWRPAKLATQVALAAASPWARPVVASRLYLRTPRADVVLPRRLPRPDQPPSEYLTVRYGLFHGDGFIQTSTIMAPTTLLTQVPFTDGLRRMQELDWSLRCLELDDVGLVYAEEPLVIWHADENRRRITTDAPWRESIEWLKQSRTRVTPRAYAALAMSSVASVAVNSGSPKVFVGLLGEALRHGKPGAIDYLTYAQVWLLPPSFRRMVRDRVLGRRPVAGQEATTAPGQKTSAAAATGREATAATAQGATAG